MTSPATAVPSRPMLPIGMLFESPTNYRKVFDQVELAGMAESMKNPEVGVIQALVIRPKGKNGKHEIIAGAKRFRSAKLAGLTEVPITISDASDAGVREMQLIENLHRSDPHPLEQAAGFCDLMQLPNYNAEVIAAKTGTDRSFVYKRMQLTQLIEPLKGKFLDGKINIGHALQLCRLREEDQIETAKHGLFRNYGPQVAVSVDELGRWIEQNVYLQLKAAPWDKADALLIPAAGACTACPKRTGANLVLFDDVGKDDRCLDRVCFQAKQIAFIAITIDEAAEEGVELIKVAKGYQMRSKKLPKGVLGPDGWKEAIKAKCTDPKRAIIVAGEEQGRRLKICVAARCKHHGASYRPTPKTKADVWADKARNLPRKIDEAARSATVAAVMLRVKGVGATELQAAAMRMLEDLGGEEMLGIAAGIELELPPPVASKTPGRMNDEYARESQIRKAVIGHLPALDMQDLGRVLVGAALFDTYDDKDRAAICRRYKVEPKEIRAKIAKRMQGEFNEQKKAALATAKTTAKKAAK